jgi:TatA/E family protein of Tat protein translocase
MFGLSFWEIALILGVALVVLGPSQLPQLARTFGKSLREFRKATDEFRNTIQDEAYREEAAKTAIPARTNDAVPLKPAETLVEAEPVKPTTESTKTSA